MFDWSRAFLGNSWSLGNCALVVLLAIVLPAGEAASQSASGLAKLSAQDVFAIQLIGDVQIAPDGSRVAYVRLSPNIANDTVEPRIWLVNVATGRDVPLGLSNGAQSDPRWSPDGTRLAWISRGDSGSELIVAAPDSGPVGDPLVHGGELPLYATNLTWSPNGQYIAFTGVDVRPDYVSPSTLQMPKTARWADPPVWIDTLNYRDDGGDRRPQGPSALFIVSTATGKIQRRSFESLEVMGPLAWAPDSSAVLFAASEGAGMVGVHAAESDLHILTLSGSERTFFKREGPDIAPQTSPNGSMTAFLRHNKSKSNYANFELYVMRHDGAQLRSLTHTIDRSIETAQWIDDFHLCITYADRGAIHVAVIDLDGATVVRARTAVGGWYAYPSTRVSVAKNGAIAFSGGDSQTPSDILVLEGASGPRQITHINADLLEKRALGKAKALRVRTKDGQWVDAWLTLPPQVPATARSPLVLQVHGGPYAAFGAAFSTEDQLFAAAGYAVLTVNPRGSIGYGARFANAIEDHYPGPDYYDLMAAVDFALTEGFTNPGDLFVTGYSAGGLMTAWIVGRTDRFRAAAAQAPIVNWLSWRLLTDRPGDYWRHWSAAAMWKAPSDWWSRSPISLVGRVVTPTLVVAGDKDHVTGASEAEQFYAALKLKGASTALLRVPNAGHGSLSTAVRPSQAVRKVEAILDWFDRNRVPAIKQ